MLNRGNHRCLCHWNSTISKECAKTFFLIDAISKHFADNAVVSNLIVFSFYPLEIASTLQYSLMCAN